MKYSRGNGISVPTNEARVFVAILLVFILLTTGCLEKRRSKVLALADAEYARAGSRVCAGASISSEEIQDLFGAKAGVRYEHESGVSFSAKAGFLQGNLSSFEGNKHPIVNSYTLGTFNTSLDLDSKYFGFSMGASFMFGRDQFWLPTTEIRAGNLDLFWLEIGFGPFETPFDARAIYIGLASIISWGKLHVGISVHCPFLLSLRDDQLEIKGGNLSGECDGGLSIPVSAYGIATINLGENFGLRVGIHAAKQVSTRLGLQYTF